MALESSIRDLIIGLKSARITERKKNAENLREFLTRNAVPSLLTENSILKKGYTWNNLFDDIDDYILKELEKFETSKTFDSVTGPLCASLLHLCVSGSNKGRAYIKCERIIEACLHVLRDSRLVQAIGDAYLKLLYKDVLPHEYYVVLITPKTWEDLLDVCISASISNHSRLDDFTKLRLVLLIMKNGKNNCQFVIPLRDSLSRLKRVFHKVASDKKMQEVIIEIMLLLLETLFAECRLTLCDFVENLFPTILKFYDQNTDQKKKSLLFKLLHLTVALHHPQGRTKDEEGSLASNWVIWNNHLQYMLEVICSETLYLQKNRKQNESILKQCTHFYDLAAAVYFQEFKLSESRENEDGNSSKRQRVAYNKNKSFNDLTEELKQNHLPWLGIVQSYVRDHGSVIPTDDYTSLLNVMNLLVSNSSIHFNWDVYEDVACLTLQNIVSRPVQIEEYSNTFLSLWNSSVRNSTSLNEGHKAIHAIIQTLLSAHNLKYQNVQPLIKLYLDRGMPVTDHSVKTLYQLFNNFFNKCSHLELRIKCLKWFTQGEITKIQDTNTRELLLRLLSNENVDTTVACAQPSEYDSIYKMLFDFPEKSILFSEFELEIPDSRHPLENSAESIDVNIDVEIRLQIYLKEKLKDYVEKLQRKDIILLEYGNFVNVLLTYIDIILKYNVVTNETLKENAVYGVLGPALKLLFSTFINTVQNVQIPEKIALLQCLRRTLDNNFVTILNTEVRSYMDQSFFYCINNIITTQPSDNEDVICEGDDQEMNSITLKHNCILMLAAYCRKRADYREEILELILDSKLYNFLTDKQCVFQCIQMLNDTNVEETPLELIFTLMQHMCKDLYRDSKASLRILKILITMLDSIWLDDSMKKNCFIMVKSYLVRCEKMYYPPCVAALIYECVVKIAVLNYRKNVVTDEMFKNALVDKIKGDIHSVRLYCCYLLKLVTIYYSNDDAELFLSDLLNIFLINMSQKKESILKDESANRTLTVFHCYLALTITKKSFLQKIVIGILQFSKEKSLDDILVKKMLNKIVLNISGTDIETYLSDNMLSVLYYWFSNNRSVDDLPLHLFGYRDVDVFIKKHMNWLLAADILWRNRGNVNESDILKRICNKHKLSVETVVENCFCNIIILCLPYMVLEKYKIEYAGSENPNVFKQSSVNAEKMFKLTGHILENEKWTNLFVENLGNLVLLTAKHLSDHNSANELFQENVPEQTKVYHYPKKVFLAILKYFGELTDGDIMQYLCENQPLVIFNILFKLWENILRENVHECKVLALHAYVSFIQIIPVGFPSVAFVCNFVCRSFSNALKHCQNKNNLKVNVIGLQLFLKRFLPVKASLLQKSVSYLLPILTVKIEEGYGAECAHLLNYLIVDMKNYLEESRDVVDFISTSSQVIDNHGQCTSLSSFLEKLKMYQSNLTNPSHDSLLNMRQFLKTNKCFVNNLCTELNSKVFSEDCNTSIIHQIVHLLNKIIKSACDNKTIIEACNCLSEIGTYDLKTLVTVPPADTQKVTGASPKKYFASVVVKSLSDVLFDENPAVSNKAVETLNCLLKNMENNDSDLDSIDREILKPFAYSPCNITSELTINNRNMNKCFSEFPDGIFIQFMLSNCIPNENNNHKDWLKKVTRVLLDLFDSENNYIKTLQDVCASRSSVCRKILPALTGLVIHYSSDKYIEVLSAQINSFFNYIWERTFDDKIENSGDSPTRLCMSNMDHGHKMVVQYMLEIIDFVRLQSKYYQPRQLTDTLNYLKLKYDKVAWSATVADQNLSALYYGEIWAASLNNNVPPSSPESTTNIHGGENLQRIFRKCYVSIGEMDAMEGCGTAHLTIEDEKRKHLINTGQYSDALLLHDIALSCGAQMDHNLQCGAVRSLHKSGMHHLALQYIKSLPENDDLIDIKYECLSFLGDWSDYVDTKELEEKSKLPNCNPNSIIKVFRYACLKDCLNVKTVPDFENKLELPLTRAKLAVSRLCQNLNMENCQSVYNVLGKLHLFKDIEDYFSVRTNKLSLHDLLHQWNVEKLPTFNDFKHLEALISQRVLILEHAAKSCGGFLSEIVTLQTRYAEIGLCNKRVQLSQRLLATVKKLQSSEAVALVESQISWAKGHKEIALSLLRNIVYNPSTDVKLNARSLRQYALWMAETKRENARDIIVKYLQESLKVLNQSDHVETRLKVYHDIAKFADAEYKQVVAYMNSTIFETKVKCMESMKGTASSLKSTQTPTNDERKAFYTNDRFRALDEAEIASTKAEKERFLHLAMRYYLMSLKQCEENNLSIFRMISLWLENPCFKLDDGTFEDMLHSIPSRKFITVLPQLAPRLTNEETPLTENLKGIITRSAKEHPHHTLPILFSLKNSEKDKIIMNAAAASMRARPRSRDPRVLAAEALVAALAEDAELAPIISQMEQICDATISFANFKTIAKQIKQKIPNAENIHKLRNLDAIPIPTASIPINKDCKYHNLATLQSFENYFELVGGINCPKKITCTDSYGIKRILLIKGEDDMRQDAVMQQVFNIVNTLLEKNPVTSRKKLLIRTYKVVPMSRQSGVLEWCVGTIPLDGYLVGTGNNGAHARFRPQDISCGVARTKLTECHNQRRNDEEKLIVFTRILTEFKPVFHYFFTEHYLDPVTWYERRLAYTKSVATTSMVGYIMGLGDRHVKNILIDKKTGEVIHIDFGIAFDHGKTLHTPETIPFRLTQDIIAGFGSSGVEGIFRRCCEKTMQLLRDNQDTLLTILEVLLCDPLYSWTVTSGQQNVAANKTASLQCANDSNSSLAERALLTVSCKLSGTEGGVAGGVAVPGQVARLLQTATDPAKLCRLFPGWQPYL